MFWLWKQIYFSIAKYAFILKLPNFIGKFFSQVLFSQKKQNNHQAFHSPDGLFSLLVGIPVTLRQPRA
jgi:hypothetical protein